MGDRGKTLNGPVVRALAAVIAAGFVLGGCTTGPPPYQPPTTSPTSSASPAPGLAGVTATGGIGVRLVLQTSPPGVFDADTGALVPLKGAAGGQRLTSLLRVGTTPVLLDAPMCTATCEPWDVYVYADPGGSPRSLGKARSAAPGADRESLWLIREDGPESCRLQRVSLTGKAAGPGTPASCRTFVRQESARGLLITVNGDAAQSEDVLIDPETGRTIYQFPRIMAIAGDRLLIGGLIDFTVLDLRDGTRKQLARPVPNGTANALPSRDGRLAAVEFGDPAWQGSSVQTRDVWLLDLGTAAWRHVPSMPYATAGGLKHTGLDWSDAGDLVLADDVVGAWHPGEPAWRLGKAKPPAERGQTIVTL
ncbi:hypothetical protein ACFWY9_09615 [Amycolatopsis sp. NPDC059027]|uniref:hypothetical protein n=1 Tax=Amycolatopsis sp. NPDC059027 TaxID=3346709 RepID=UPI003670322C